jgi:urea transporter
LAALLALSGGAKAVCVIAHLVDVPVQIVAGVPMVGGQVNGVTLPFVLDTSAQRSLVADAAVQRAALRLDGRAATTNRRLPSWNYLTASPGPVPPHRRSGH